LLLQVRDGNIDLQKYLCCHGFSPCLGSTSGRRTFDIDLGHTKNGDSGFSLSDLTVVNTSDHKQLHISSCVQSTAPSLPSQAPGG
jgi:hypothetical protein